MSYTELAPPAIACVTLTPQTVHYLVFENLLDHPFWLAITHVLLAEWLVFPEAPPAKIQDVPDPNTYSSAITFLNVIEDLKLRYPHLLFYWSLPRLHLQPELTQPLAKMATMYLRSLVPILEYYPCDGLEIDSYFVDTLWAAHNGMNELNYLLRYFHAELWITMVHPVHRPEPAFTDFLNHVQVEAFIIKAFGFVRYGQVRYNTHGISFPMIAVHDSEFEDTAKVVAHCEHAWNIAPSRLLLSIDTSGIVYTMHKGHVANFDTIPLKEVRRQRYLAGPPPTALPNSGTAQVGDKLIYYDDPGAQFKKLDLSSSLRGAVIGPLEQDLCVSHPDSLVYRLIHGNPPA